MGGTGRTSTAPSALGCWLRTLTAELPVPPLGRRGEQNFLCGCRNRQPSPPQPHIPGLSQHPRASQTREFPLVPGPSPRENGIQDGELQPSYRSLARASPHQDLDLLPHPNNQRSPTSSSYWGLLWGKVVRMGLGSCLLPTALRSEFMLGRLCLHMARGF